MRNFSNGCSVTMLLFDDAIDIDSVLISDAARDLAISTALFRSGGKKGLFDFPQVLDVLEQIRARKGSKITQKSRRVFRTS